MKSLFVFIVIIDLPGLITYQMGLFQYKYLGSCSRYHLASWAEFSHELKVSE